jgi:hypothetical protein
LTTYQSAIATAGIENNRQRIAGLRNILDPSLTHHYDSSLATLNINLLGAADNSLVTALKNAVFTEFDRPALCEYLSRGQLNTADLQPQAFYQRLQALKTYAVAMPGNAAVPNDETLRLTFFNATPHATKERFGKMHGLPSNMATPELILFMERQMRHSSRPSSSNGNGNHGNGNHGNGNSNYGNNNNGNHGNRRNNSNWNRHGNSSRRNQCPLHPGAPHSFSECFANPRSTKYDADCLHARSTQQGDRPSSSGSRTDTIRGPGNFASNNRSAPNAHVTQTDSPPDSVPASNAHMNRGTLPFDESLALDPLPCHAGAAGPSTVDDGPLEGEPLARSAVHHFNQIGPSFQVPGSIDHDVDEEDSVTIEAFAEAFAEAFLNDDSQSVSFQ